jgi:hypothetical protein
MLVQQAVSPRSFRVGDQGGSGDLFRELPLGLSGKAEAPSARSAPPEALRPVESRDPLGYFSANTPFPVFS